ncbi:hypothetical protein AB1N83_002967 [Pleurotus pulmonarius]
MVSLYCLTLCLSLLDVVAAATIINVTQDDSPNDSQGRVALSYLGPWSHQQVATCNDADQCPEPFSQTRNGTWSTSLYVQNSRLNDRPPSVSFGFQGTAIYINCVIIPHDILGISADSDMVFMLDGVVTGRFARQSPESGAISLATVLMRDSLLDGYHTLSIQNGAEFENQTHNVSVLALDSITYTTNDSPSIASTARMDSSSFFREQQRKQRTHIILAGVMSSLAGLGVIVLSFWFCLRRKQRKPFLPIIFQYRPTPRTLTPYSKASSSPASLGAPSRHFDRGGDDTSSVLSSVPPSYHSRSSTVP